MGKEDQWIQCEQAKLLGSKIKDSKVVTIEGAEHLIIEEKPDALIKEILEFFKH